MKLELKREEIPDHLLGYFKPIGYKPKDLIDTPHMVSEELRRDGWYLRSEIIWAKPNPMPESVTDRPTKAHETIFLLTKCPQYFYDADAIREHSISGDGTAPRGSYGVLGVQNAGNRKPDKRANKGRFEYNGKYDGSQNQRAFVSITQYRNKRSVWAVSTEATPFAHFATFPRKLITPMILAGCPVGGVVLDPFMGSGTTALVARDLGRQYIGSELNPEYVAIAERRLSQPFTLPMLFEAETEAAP